MNIQGKKVAILATQGFEQAELTEPRKALRAAGATVHLVAPEAGEIRGFKHYEQGDAFKVDRRLDQVRADDYDALVIPGGLFSPDSLRVNPAALEFVRAFERAGKPLAAICHGPWLLVDAGLAKGRTLTAVAAIRRDLSNAGAEVLDREVVIDGSLITSRTPRDLPAFCRALIGRLAGQDADTVLEEACAETA